MRAFRDPRRFSPEAFNISFEHLGRGEMLDVPLGVHGVRLTLGGGEAPRVWQDAAARRFRIGGRSALTNRESGHTRPGDTTKPSGLALEPEECALEATFEVPVNRVGFEIRRLEGRQLNVLVTCTRGGEELGTLFFDAFKFFSFVGVESSEPFDGLRIEFTNPPNALFSIDNLHLELDRRDRDNDGVMDAIDLCPVLSDKAQRDSDGDGIGDACDRFPSDPDNDIDGDGLGRNDDNCPLIFNPGQLDLDRDGVGDACDTFVFGSDGDRDGIGDEVDNCPSTFNPEQFDCDMDGVGDACDTTLITPASVSVTLARGACVTIQKVVCLPPSPPVVDVVIAFDTTGSMGGEIQALRQRVVGFVNEVRQALPTSDIRFGLVSFKDYPDVYGTCGYMDRYSRPGDEPFKVDAPIGATDEQVLEAVNSLVAHGGFDQPEAYGRVLWEIEQPDSGINFRESSARFVLLIGDAPPHDCNLALGLGGCVPHLLSTGVDPGRDGQAFTADDIDFHEDAVRPLREGRVRVLMVYSGSIGFCAWDHWCRVTRGFAVQAGLNGKLPPETSLSGLLVDLIHNRKVKAITIDAVDPCGLDITFDPGSIIGPIDVSQGARVTFDETICVPSDLPAGTTSLDCSVDILSDGALLGTQTVHVDVACSLQVLDFETEDDLVTPLHNGQALLSPPQFGRRVSISSAGANLGPAIFDSTPGGPNDPSINSDMLVGHGNMLLLQDSNRSRQTNPGFFDEVTDDPDGGDLIFNFIFPIDPKSILLADINPPPNRGASVTLIDRGGRTRVYAVDPGWTGTYGNAGPWRLDLTTLLPQPGNGTPRFARATEQEGFEQTGVIRIVFHNTGYGAMDELVFCQ